MRGAEMNKWKLADKEELDSMEWKKTWKQAVLSPGKNSIPFRVVLKQKLAKQGCITCYEGRPTKKDYVQKNGFDYDESFAPVMRFYMLLLNFGKFTSLRLHVRHVETYDAFLKGYIYSELYLW